ncbi:sigma-70 family RNA polymerase sigma factor [Wenjunlia tyrosinilytica]|uniref:RNA polymerase sigma-70 region 2 domain-containing protein n=1 Tax=Wenjunlia tyrosinilytica TaxID=1544741 RepID=A0A917ZY46_9ACTN|nr:sigma-70 family RNA polymerase sigma factor [Wenjunlia tyrosinilytica]GGP00356.1 hypothetical protein GCM10012280_68940 [Wenjunlia tyrosinilytica]
MASEPLTLSELSDADLVLCLRQEPRPPRQARTQVYQVIIERHAHDIHRYLAGTLRNAEDANDVGQITFTEALKLLEDCRWPAESARLGGWLMEIAKLRVRKHRSRGAKEVLGFEESTVKDLADHTQVVHRGHDPVRLAEVLRLLPEVVASLDPFDQKLYQFRHVAELGTIEIAARLNKPEKTISNRSTRLCHKIAERFHVLILTKGDRTRCPELARILDEHVGKGFTKDLYKQVVKHYSTCPTCGDCVVCRREINALKWDYAPALIPVVFATAFREQVSQAIEHIAPKTHAAPHQPSAGRGAPAGMGATAIAVSILLFTSSSTPPGSQTTPAPPLVHASPVANVLPCKEESIVRPPKGRIPATVHLPNHILLPAEAAVAGSRDVFYGENRPHFVLGPKGSTCQASRGADGNVTFGMERDNHHSGVIEAWSPGGVSIQRSWGCEYIPEVASLVSDHDCTQPSGHVVEPISTGTPNFYASLVWAPQGDRRLWNDGITRSNSTVALFVSQVSTSGGSSIYCNLPDRQDKICAASLSLFLAQSGESAGIKSDNYKRLASTIRAFVEHH